MDRGYDSITGYENKGYLYNGDESVGYGRNLRPKSAKCGYKRKSGGVSTTTFVQVLCHKNSCSEDDTNTLI